MRKVSCFPKLRLVDKRRLSCQVKVPEARKGSGKLSGIRLQALGFGLRLSGLQDDVPRSCII